MPLEDYKAELKELKARDRFRSLSGESGLDFSSNDYLALSRAPSIRRALEKALAEGIAIGSGGSRLLRGNHPAHEELESQAATFFGAERALYFTSGYAANFTILSSLPKRGDLVIFDELLHASAREGLQSGLAKRCKVRHNDLQAFEDALRKWRTSGGKGQPWIAVESLYSMDGDFAPVAGLVGLAERYEALLVVDEAHATGVHGPLGRGLTAPFEGRDNLIVVHTCGKALGATGGLVCASKTLVDYIINRGRPFIYTTAPSPLMALAVSEALNLLEREPERREALTQLIAFANSQLTAKTGFPGSGSQIIPVVLGADGKALQAANFLRERGFDIRAARPPTVPEGTARLRIAITLNSNEAQVEQMLDTLAEALADSGSSAEVAQ